MTEPVKESHRPPADVPASELWLALTSLPCAHEVIDFPVSDPILGQSIGKVAIVPLGVEDLMVCQKMADEWARNLMKNQRDPDAKVDETSDAFKKIAADEASVQILWRALKDPTDKTLEKPAIPAPAMLRRKPFTADLLAVLTRAYLRVCLTRGPIIATMSVEEMDAWLDVLEEGGAGFPFDLLSAVATFELLKHSAARSKALRMANFSVGLPPAAASSSDKTSTPPASSNPLDGTPSLPEADSPPALAADVLEIPKS